MDNISELRFRQITFENIKGEIETFLKKEYSRSGVVFDTSSPYGQLLSVIENLHQLSFLYLKNSLQQLDITDPESDNSKVIRNMAVMAGHNPGRNISASGTLRFTLKTDADPEKDVPGGRITLNNKMVLKNKTNSLEYSLNLGTDKQTFKITPQFQFYVPIIQGKWEKKTFTGSGDENQTFQVNLRSQQKDVENFNYSVYVNGEYWQLRKHIYEMIPDEKACVIRTGFAGGIDIIFGNGSFGMVPEIGSTIEVSYLVSDGGDGNIFRRTPNDWTFVDQALDGFGNTIDMGNIFDVIIYTDINFGANRESVRFTKNILPITSNNFVLALPQQYAYQIKKLGVFSHVNAYENNGSIFIVATPNIKLFKNQNANYFSVDLKAFELDNYEKSKIDKYLRTSGNIMLTKKYKIESPTLSFYVMNIFLMTYSDSIDENVNAQIYDTISEYFLNLNKIDRIPKLDIIRELSSIPDIHSVDITFISKKNEDHHRAGLTKVKNSLIPKKSQIGVDAKTDRNALGNYNPKVQLGIDPVLGDIIFDKNEVPVIRGGWKDRNNVFYSDNIDYAGLRSVNIILKGKIDVKNKNV